MIGRPGYRTMETMEEVRRRTSLAPLASPCFILSLLSLETEGLLAFQGRAGITSIVWWNLRPVIFGVEYRKRAYIKNFEGGGLGAAKFFMLNFFACFFAHEYSSEMHMGSLAGVLRWGHQCSQHEWHRLDLGS